MGKVIRERDIEKYLVKRVKELGGEVRKVKWIGRRGAPDRVVGLPGERRPIFVEIKRPGEGLTAAQAREHKRLEKLGFEIDVVASFEAVDELLLFGF